MSRVLVLAEHRKGALREVSLEALTAARSLSSTGITAVLLGRGTGGLAEELARHAPRVLHLDGESYAHYDPVVWTAALVEQVGRESARALVMPHSYHGMDLAGRLAATLDWPVITDVTGITQVDDRVRATRMVYGGRVEAQVAFAAGDPVLLTVRPTAFSAGDAGSEPGAIETPGGAATCDPAIRFLEYVEEEAGDVDISQSEIIVSVGRGIGEEENLDLVRGLADALGGEVACSRPIVDRGWMPRPRQVGTSGRSIRPKVYLAIGISGAFQHVAGMKGAGRVIAINRDPHAPIFKTADYGIVGDLFEIVPALTQVVRERRG